MTTGMITIDKLQITIAIEDVDDDDTCNLDNNNIRDTCNRDDDHVHGLHKIKMMMILMMRWIVMSLLFMRQHKIMMKIMMSMRWIVMRLSWHQR